MPPTERKGRVQTSTVTVAVTDSAAVERINIKDSDIEYTFCRGSGAGGQHRNVTNSAVQAVHLPTGIRVRVESERSQHQNKEQARTLIASRIIAATAASSEKSRAEAIKNQVGSGMRGDKVRTVRTQDDQVTDHKSGRTIRFKDYSRGNWEGLGW